MSSNDTSKKLESRVSTNGRCGPDYSGRTCPGTTCCSKYHWCGTTDEHCRDYWNGNYDGRGKHFTSRLSRNGRCGPDFGGTVCPTGTCCSKYSWCGTTGDHCRNYWNGGYDGYGKETQDEILRREKEAPAILYHWGSNRGDINIAYNQPRTLLETPGSADLDVPIGVGAVEVRPGYKLCIYSVTNQRTTHGPVPYFCAEEGLTFLPSVNRGWMNNKVVGYRLLKDCNHRMWLWDKDCSDVDPSKVVNSCWEKDSLCYKNRLLYCGTGDHTDENCIPFCKKESGMCDGLMKRYCDKEENAKKPVCSCLNSPALKYNPVCIDGTCIKSGYLTKNMSDKPCPDIVDCGIYYDIKDTGGNVQFADNNIEQRCGTKEDRIPMAIPPQPSSSGGPSQSPSPSPSPSQIPSPSPSPSPSPNQNPSSSQSSGQNQSPGPIPAPGQSWLYKAIIAIVILLIIVGLAAYFILGGSDTSIGAGAGVGIGRST